MEMAQKGDERAYVDLLKQVAVIVGTLVRRRAPRLAQADVEDLVQETLASIHMVRATYDPSRPFLPWLMAIAHNR